VKPPTGPIDADEDGNAVPVPPAESDLAQLIQLLEYGRKRGFRIGPTVKIGQLVTQVQDLRQTEGTMADLEPGVDPWKAAGYEGDE
jgi:hypothetical protein